MEHKDPLAEAVGANLKAGAVGRKWIVAARPAVVVVRLRGVGIVFTIVEDHLKHPGIVWKLSRVNGLPSHSVAIRHTIAILDALQIAIRRPAGLTAILLVCSCNKLTLLILKNPPRILTLVLI